MNLKGWKILLLMKLKYLKKITSKIILKKNRYIYNLERNPAAYDVKA